MFDRPNYGNRVLPLEVAAYKFKFHQTFTAEKENHFTCVSWNLNYLNYVEGIVETT